MKNLTEARQIRIGTRGSALALAQAHEVRDRLTAIYGDKVSFEIVIIKTTGDKILDRALAAVGGKGLFTKELEEQLLDNTIDIAVHSMKDMQAELPNGLEVGCVLPREDVRDAFISPVAKSLADLPSGSIVGTASIRREAFIRNRRPDLKMILFRGNVQTRLRKLEEGEAHATLLASAGLRRLGLADRITQVIPVEDMLPAPAQGAIGIEMRSADHETKEIFPPSTIAICSSPLKPSVPSSASSMAPAARRLRRSPVSMATRSPSKASFSRLMARASTRPTGKAT